MGDPSRPAAPTARENVLVFPLETRWSRGKCSEHRYG